MKHSYFIIGIVIVFFLIGIFTWSTTVKTNPDFSMTHAIDVKISDEVCGKNTVSSKWHDSLHTILECDYENYELKPVATTTAFVNDNEHIIWTGNSQNSTGTQYNFAFVSTSSPSNPVLDINGFGQVFFHGKLVGTDPELGKIIEIKPYQND